MDKRRKEREIYRRKKNGYYHLCTDGLKGRLLFNDAAEYAFGTFLLGLIGIKYNLKLYAYELMPNHLHIILSGKGENCLKAFDYLKRKLSARLVRDGYPPLPGDYWFKLVEIESEKQMRNEMVYLLRNAPEKGLGTATGYLWGSGWLYHSGWSPEVLGGTMAADLSGRSLRKLLMGTEPVPPHWRIHPYLGLLPHSFIDTSMAHRLFPTPKDLQTALVKDYENYFQTARRLGELAVFSKQEIDDIVSGLLQTRFGGRTLRALTPEEKGKLAILLHLNYGLTSSQIAAAIFVKETTIRQLLLSKELN